jgi:hypothetical protein
MAIGLIIPSQVAGQEVCIAADLGFGRIIFSRLMLIDIVQFKFWFIRFSFQTGCTY